MKRFLPILWIWIATAGFACLPVLDDVLAQSASVSAPTQQGPAVDLDFANSAYYQSGQNCTTIANCIATSRASSGTNLLPTSVSGFAYATFGNNVARITAGSGDLIEEARTNQLLNSAVPATQTTGALAATAQTLWVNGSGSAILSNGSATGCAGTATNGSPVTFTPTAGTCTVTVSGSLNAFQLEAGSFGTSLIVSAGSATARAADVVTLTNVPAVGNGYTLFLNATPNAPTAYASGQVALSLDAGSGSNFAEISRQGGVGKIIFTSKTGGVSTNSTSVAVVSQNAAFKAAFAVTSGDQAGTLDAATILAQSATAPVGPMTVLRLGNEGGAALFDGYISRIALWPTTRLPNAQLQNITNTNWAANDNLPDVANDNELLKLWAAR